MHAPTPVPALRAAVEGGPPPEEPQDAVVQELGTHRVFSPEEVRQHARAQSGTLALEAGADVAPVTSESGNVAVLLPEDQAWFADHAVTPGVSEQAAFWGLISGRLTPPDIEDRRLDLVP